MEFFTGCTDFWDNATLILNRKLDVELLKD